MHINYEDTVLVAPEQILRFQKTLDNDLVVSSTIVFDSDKMVEYQKELFMDYLSELVDQLSDEKVTFKEARRVFENGLKDINVKLQVFAEKMGEDKKFPIHGAIQVVYKDDYLASFIGKSGLIIIRDKKLHYMLTNKPVANNAVDQFSETVEGEVRVNDTLITCGFDVETYLDKDDLATILGTAQSEERPFLKVLEEVVTTRLDKEEMRYASRMVLESSFSATQKKFKKRIDGPLKMLASKLGGWEKMQSKALFGLIGIVTLLLLYGLFQSFYNANNETFVSRQGDQQVDINIQDIQRDISMFEKIDPSSDQKIKKYEEIQNKLDILVENDKWVDDVSKYRSLLEEKYLEGFNIISANNDSFFRNPVYEFSQTELNTFSSPQQIFYTDSLIVAGEEGILLNAINNEQRGSLISAGIDQTINTCGFNLLRNGLYCDTSTGMFNIVKQGFQPVNSADGTFPSNIVSLDRFGSSNMYILTNDPALNSGNIYITRYTNQLGSQEEFSAGANYAIEQEEDDDLAFAGSGFSSFAIDGTFLTWSTADKALYQLWRPPNSNTTNLNYRQVPLNGGDTLNAYSEDVKVIASEAYRYVYLFDQENQTFTVYRSSPYKTNTAYTYDYSLEYLFRVQYSFDEFEIIDVFVQEGENATLYMLSDKGVYTMNLSDNIERYNQQLDTE